MPPEDSSTGSIPAVALAEGDEKHLDLSIRREVSTAGLVACDTHVHTLTYSGHGDATIDERAVTLAGEGIELPIAATTTISPATLLPRPFAWACELFLRRSLVTR